MYQIIQGDCIEGMRQLPDESVHCVVTSPPYYGLRDYGTATWIGGDADCNHTISHWSDNLKPNVSRPMGAHRGGSASHCHLCGAERIDQQIGLEDTPDAYVDRLVNVFREVRRILRHDGTVWLNLGDSYASSGISQPQRDVSGGFTGRDKGTRGTQGYSNASGAGVKRYIPNNLKPKDLIGIPWRVAFALQADGWWLRQDIIWHKPNPMPESVTDRCTKSHEYIFLLTKSERYYYDHEAIKEKSKYTWNSAKSFSAGGLRANEGLTSAGGVQWNGTKTHEDVDKTGRNKRSVWTVQTRPYKEAHFAVFPPKLIEPCVLAGSPEGGTVFDPFTGSGTTALVAIQHGRSFVGTELNPEYIALAEKRLGSIQKRLF